MRAGEVEVDMASLCRQLAELCRFGVSFPLPKNAYLVAPGPLGASQGDWQVRLTGIVGAAHVLLLGSVPFLGVAKGKAHFDRGG